jgi:2',3'-cyclic-nucleotide 2'-phosphodiesterase (5'-nucleotidase family)
MNRVLTRFVTGLTLAVLSAAGVSAQDTMTIWYDPRRRVGDRVRHVRLPNDQRLRENRTYTLAVSDFLASGGAGFDMLVGVREVERVDLFAVDALANYLGRLPQLVAITSVTRFRLDR